jgi:hypothetical protein
MGFQHIKVLADKVLKDATAAHADKLRMNLGGDGPMSQGEGEPLSPSPIARSGGGDTESNSNEVVGKRGNAAPPVARGVHQTIEPFGAASIASLTVVRDMMVVRNAKPQGVRHEARPARVSATIISLATYRAHVRSNALTGAAF